MPDTAGSALSPRRGETPLVARVSFMSKSQTEKSQTAKSQTAKSQTAKSENTKSNPLGKCPAIHPVPAPKASSRAKSIARAAPPEPSRYVVAHRRAA